MKFENFKRARYNEPPYDLPSNPHLGFNRQGGSDISAHLPFLEYIASQCDAITEFGTRDCYSTAAFLAGCNGCVYSYDIVTTPSIEQLRNITDKPCQWVFRQRSTIDPSLRIEESDLLFVDTLHTYDQVQAELAQHADFVNRYIMFHDTVSFPDINRAIDEFMRGGKWKKVYEVRFNHGLLLIERDSY